MLPVLISLCYVFIFHIQKKIYLYKYIYLSFKNSILDHEHVLLIKLFIQIYLSVLKDRQRSSRQLVYFPNNLRDKEGLGQARS